MQTMSYTYGKWYNTRMRRCKETKIKAPEALLNLLNQRRLPLSEEGEEKTLHELGFLLSAYQGYVAAVHLPASVRNEMEVSPEEIEMIDLLEGEDEKYLPVFTDSQAMDEAPFDVRENSILFYCDVLDLHSLLTRSHADAIVLNPGQDDLFLSEQLLENMIRMDPKNNPHQYS